MANINILGRPVDGDSPFQDIKPGDVVLNPLALLGEIKVITADETLDDEDGFVLVDETGGAVTVTLPAPDRAGQSYFIKQTTGGANNTTINTADDATIDGAASQSLTSQWEWYQVISDGTDWFIISSG